MPRRAANHRYPCLQMCWCLRWGRARRATITPPFANHVHLQHAGSTGRASEVGAGPQPPLSLCQYSSLVSLEAPPTA